ncbi:MAG: family 78 glycoside hydrolase catalytic domain, partial [Clostridia bacterium]|nr:family 78 glycoside hydrolase catalytic domain [Clostridia bacterium]
MFENAKWITRTPWIQWRMPSYEELPPAPYLTKSFDVEKAVASAVLNIVAYGQGAYFINGKRIPDSYLPTVHSLTDKTLVYSSYDLAGDIVKGKNKIGVVIGNGFQTNHANTYRGYVRMIAQLDITYKDGTEEQIVSDTSWKTADSPTLFDMRRCGEKFDARLKINGWCDPDFDDSAWDNAFICKGLGGKFRKRIVEPIRIMRLIRGIEIENSLFDFGTNTSGWARINVKGKRGNEIVIKYSENLTEDGKNVDQSSITNGGSHKDQYIMEGNPNGEEWEQTFIYHGFRYVEIEGEYDEITVDAVVAFTDMPLTSSFSCDN